MNRECAATITNTGNNAADPFSSGIRLGGNHKSHCAASPAAHTSRSAGSGRRCSGRNRRTLSRNHVIDPDQPTRSASTVADISGNSASIARTRSSNGVNDVASFGTNIVRVEIFDVTGMSVWTATGDGVTAIQWAGVDEGNNVLETGAYIYRAQDSSGGATNGVIVVAK